MTRSQSPGSQEEALKLIEQMTQRIAELEGGEIKLKDELDKHIQTIEYLKSELEKANEESKLELEKEWKKAQQKLLIVEDELSNVRTERSCLNRKLELAKAESASKDRYLDYNARKLLEKDREIQEKNREIEELRRQMRTSSIGSSKHQIDINP